MFGINGKTLHCRTTTMEKEHHDENVGCWIKYDRKKNKIKIASTNAHIT